MRSLKKLIGLPKPRALPMRIFSRNEEYTWEDWEEETKKKHPIKFFLSETIPFYFDVYIKIPLQHTWFKIKYKVWRREHLLDLRQPYTGTSDDYTYGWLYPSKKMLYANFNILTKFFETCDIDIALLKARIDKVDEIEKKYIDDQIHSYNEAKELYYYWTVERKLEFKKISELSSALYKKRIETGERDPNIWAEYNELCIAIRFNLEAH